MLYRVVFIKESSTVKCTVYLLQLHSLDLQICCNPLKVLFIHTPLQTKGGWIRTHKHWFKKKKTPAGGNINPHLPSKAYAPLN